MPWISTDMPVAGASSSTTSPPVDEELERCDADQLTAEFQGWVEKGESDPAVRDENAGIWGRVIVTNTSSKSCRLAGQPEAAVLDGRDVVARSNDGGINDEALRRQVALAPGDQASLRMDWSPPGCGIPTADQRVEVELPEGAGVVDVEPERAAAPGCLQGDAGDGLRSKLSGSTFETFQVAAGSASPLEGLTATISAPATFELGADVMAFEVTLTNTTSEPIWLDPCPYYSLDMVSPPNAEQGFGGSELKLLNCVPRPSFEAGESVRFEMKLTVPGAAVPGDALIAWRILDLHLDKSIQATASLQLTATT